MIKSKHSKAYFQGCFRVLKELGHLPHHKRPTWPVNVRNRRILNDPRCAIPYETPPFKDSLGCVADPITPLDHLFGRVWPGRSEEEGITKTIQLTFFGCDKTYTIMPRRTVLM